MSSASMAVHLFARKVCCRNVLCQKKGQEITLAVAKIQINIELTTVYHLKSASLRMSRATREPSSPKHHRRSFPSPTILSQSSHKQAFKPKSIPTST